MNGVWSISLLAIGLGFIVGRGGLFFVIGGYVCYWVLTPMLYPTENFKATEWDAADGAVTSIGSHINW